VVCEEAMCRPKTHIGPKSREAPNHFSQPRYLHVHIVSYPKPTSGHPLITSTPSIFFPHYLSDTCPFLISRHLCHLTPYHLHPITPHLSLVCTPRYPQSPHPSKTIHLDIFRLLLHAECANHFISSHVYRQASP
jgi:hypothetical protein